jgi:large subunit ribosomal protein L1
MPNPKTGTVTDDTATAVNAVKAGRIDYKIDKSANIAAACGKLSFSEEQLQENLGSLVDSIVKAKPASAKGNYIQSFTLAASMLPGISLDMSMSPTSFSLWTMPEPLFLPSTSFVDVSSSRALSATLQRTLS